jgi:hypothetical protein
VKRGLPLLWQLIALASVTFEIVWIALGHPMDVFLQICWLACTAFSIAGSIMRDRTIGYKDQTIGSLRSQLDLIKQDVKTLQRWNEQRQKPGLS